MAQLLRCGSIHAVVLNVGDHHAQVSNPLNLPAAYNAKARAYLQAEGGEAVTLELRRQALDEAKSVQSSSSRCSSNAIQASLKLLG